MRTRYENARLLSACGIQSGAVTVEDGRIVPSALPADEIVDLTGLVLMPALADLHCHLRDPGYPAKETLETGMRAALKGGYATLTAMANTDPVMETPQQVAENHRRAGALGLCHLVQAAAAGVGLKDEKPTDRAALSRVTRVISNDGKTIFSEGFMRQLLLDSAKHGFLISTHCQPERDTVARDLRLVREVGGKLHVGHISRRETLEMIKEAKAAGLPVTCEVTPHHLFGFDSDYRVNPPLRTREDVQALIRGVKDGDIDCLSTDHAPHTEADKAAGMAGIDNIEYALQIFLQVFHENGIPLTRLVQMGALTPLRLLGREGGTLEPGSPADLVAFDPEAEDTIDAERMVSRSHNTPFSGRAVRGRVAFTMVNGRILYDNRQTV